MKKIFTLFLEVLIAMFFSFNLYAIQPTFNLSAINFQFTDSIGTGGVSYDAMTFDIYIHHSNLGSSGPFEFALGQYYFNVKAIGGVSSDYTYYILPGTTQFTNPNALPRNSTFVMPDATSPTGASLRVNSNTVLGAGNGPIVSSSYPGTRICTFRFKKKVGSFDPINDLGFFQSGTGTYGSNVGSAWRLALPNPYTKVWAYIGTTNTDISLQGTYTVDYYYYPYPPPPIIILTNPPNYSVNNSSTINFNWIGYNSVEYNLQISSDSLFNNIIINETIIVDTFKTLSGFNINTKYFWRVIAENAFGTSRTSSVWNFTTSPGTVLNLKIIPEGIYYNLFNQLGRRDTVTVYLRNITSPYSIVDSSKAVIDSMNFTGSFIFQNTPSGTYYIATKHLNSIETWSKAGGEPMTLNGSTNYDFTTATSQAYGNNLKLKGSKYCAYSGDVNQDGIIDASDLIKVYNDSYVGLTGRYLVSDMNGDNIVDASDISTTDNNVFAGILKIIP